MNEKFELTKFSAGDAGEHEGVTYEAARRESEMCGGRAFYKRGEPCKSPGGWLCVEIGTEKNLIFKKAE